MELEMNEGPRFDGLDALADAVREAMNARDSAREKGLDFEGAKAEGEDVCRRLGLPLASGGGPDVNALPNFGGEAPNPDHVLFVLSYDEGRYLIGSESLSEVHVIGRKVWESKCAEEFEDMVNRLADQGIPEAVDEWEEELQERLDADGPVP